MLCKIWPDKMLTAQKTVIAKAISMRLFYDLFNINETCYEYTHKSSFDVMCAI